MYETLTEGQEQGLKIAVDRYKAGCPYTCIAGYAGVGKSFLVKHIVAALGFKPNEVAYIAYTGQAAQVLKQKGNPNAMTAHKLLYKARPMPNGGFKFFPKTLLDENYKMIVVDEVSMLPKQMWDLLLRHKIYIVACGDPAQLPCINPDNDNHILDKPHIFLTKIMRQAEESEIIRLSMWVREGKPLSEYKPDNEQVQIYKENEVVSGMYSWADQIICATNKNRRKINDVMFNLKGLDKENLIDAKVINLHNQWEFFDTTNTYPLVNGSKGTIEYCYKEKVQYPNYIVDKPIEILYAQIKTDDDLTYSMIPIDYSLLTTGKTLVTDRARYLMNKNSHCPDAPFVFDYGYCISCHKSQGDQYNKVLLFEEGFPYDKKEHSRWLYTGITRAVDKLVIIEK